MTTLTTVARSDHPAGSAPTAGGVRMTPTLFALGALGVLAVYFSEGLTACYESIVGFDRRMSLDVELGPLAVHLYGRSVFYMWVTVSLLAMAGVAVAASRRRELIQKWTTWAMTAMVVGLPFWIGAGTTAVLAAALAVVAVLEYSRLVKLSRADTGLLVALAVVFPMAAWLRPSALMALAPVAILVSALPSVLAGDVHDGTRRAAYTAFGAVWICWSLSLLVVLWPQAFLLFFAVAVTDVAAWCGGKGLRRFEWARRPLSPLSPNKTVGGLAGAVAGAVLVLTLLGTISIGLVIAVAFGGVFGDLLESMVKRQAQVKDAGAWLPGFGGLLDRIDSLMLVLPLALLLG